jgi:hypothetical protein
MLQCWRKEAERYLRRIRCHKFQQKQWRSDGRSGKKLLSTLEKNSSGKAALWFSFSFKIKTKALNLRECFLSRIVLPYDCRIADDCSRRDGRGPGSGLYPFLKNVPQNVRFFNPFPITGLKCRYIVLIYAIWEKIF